MATDKIGNIGYGSSDEINSVTFLEKVAGYRLVEAIRNVVEDELFRGEISYSFGSGLIYQDLSVKMGDLQFAVTALGGEVIRMDGRYEGFKIFLDKESAEQFNGPLCVFCYEVACSAQRLNPLEHVSR